MPRKAPVMCANCRETTTNRNGYCDQCSRDRVWRHQKKGDPFYWSPEWRKVRAIKLRKDPLCEDCFEEGRVTPAKLVDHVKERKDGGAPLKLENLKSQCYKCHAVKTAVAKREREGLPESPLTPPAQPFGRKTEVAAKLGGGGISEGGHYGKR